MSSSRANEKGSSKWPSFVGGTLPGRPRYPTQSITKKKEILLLLLGAFIGSYNRVIDFWFNNAERDNLLIEKVDDEDDEVKVVGDGDGGYSVEVKK